MLINVKKECTCISNSLGFLNCINVISFSYFHTYFKPKASVDHRRDLFYIIRVTNIE